MDLTETRNAKSKFVGCIGKISIYVKGGDSSSVHIRFVPSVSGNSGNFYDWQGATTDVKRLIDDLNLQATGSGLDGATRKGPQRPAIAERLAEDPFERASRKDRALREAEKKERATLDALSSRGADVMRRSRELQAERQRAIEEAVAEAAKPASMLVNAYRNYLVVRQCFEGRADFAVVYLTPQQLDEAKTQVKSIEAEILRLSPSLDKEERWATANREETAANQDIGELAYTGRGAVKERAFTEQGRRFCGMAVSWLRETYGELYPESRTVKKDF